MEMHERIKYLRKELLHLTQEDFGVQLGVNRGVINNLERNALSRQGHILSLVKLISLKFSINENWILYGENPISSVPEVFSLDAFAEEHAASALELEFIKAYFELPKETREFIVKHFENRIKKAP